MGAGTGGEAEAYHLTLESGAHDIELGDFDFLIGVGIPLILHENEIPENTFAVEAPHDDITIEGVFEDGTEWGLLAKIGIEVFNSNFYLFGLGGITRVSEITISRSNITGWYYEESTDEKSYPLYGGGMAYFSEIFDYNTLFQLEYDIRRGGSVGVGFYW